MMKRSTATMRSAPFAQTQVLREIEYIVGRAREHDVRVVGLGPLVFFSSQTGDAWMLDAEDHFARQLARDGVPLPVPVADLGRRLSLTWTSTFRFDDDLFIVEDLKTPSTKMIAGYALDEIAARCQRAR